MRIGAHQPADPLQDHPVFVVERRILDRDSDLALRETRVFDILDMRGDLAALLVEDERAKRRHGQLRSGSRMLTKLATAAPPMFRRRRARRRGSACRRPCPVTCIDASTCIDTPVAPTGWPFDLSPPDGLIGSVPSFSVQPSRIARAPSPGGGQPHRLVLDQLGDGEAVVRLDQIEIVEAEPRGASAFFQASAGPSKARMSRRLIGRKSLTCSAARNTTAFFIASAVGMSASTTAAAPSDTSEQSVRFNGPATSGFLSETVRQNS